MCLTVESKSESVFSREIVQRVDNSGHVQSTEQRTEGDTQHSNSAINDATCTGVGAALVAALSKVINFGLGEYALKWLHLLVAFETYAAH